MGKERNPSDKEISNACYAMVSEEFELNRKRKGIPWGQFGESAASRCEREIHLYLGFGDGSGVEKARSAARRFGGEIALGLMRKIGLGA